MIEFDPELRASDAEIILVGCGGTGSALAPLIGRTLHHMRANRISIPERLVIVDPDTVEEKNIGRQGFTIADVGSYKAEIWARRLSLAFGLEVEFYNEAFAAKKHVKHYNYRYQPTILLGAVDSYIGRREMANLKTNTIWIDAGNHKAAGQVVIGNTGDIKEINESAWENRRDKDKIQFIPNAALLFPELLEAPEEPEPELSCAELLQLNQQHLLVNQQMALIAGQYLYKLLMREPIYSNYTVVDTDYLVMRSEMITREHLVNVVKQIA